MSCRLIFQAGVKGGSGKMRAARFDIAVPPSRWTSLIHPMTKRHGTERTVLTPASTRESREHLFNGANSEWQTLTPQCFVFFYRLFFSPECQSWGSTRRSIPSLAGWHSPARQPEPRVNLRQAVGVASLPSIRLVNPFAQGIEVASA